MDCGYIGPPFKWNIDRRFLLRSELDAAFLHLYGIGRDDIFHLLENFHVVKGDDMAAHGEYRTRRVILEIYDEMAEAMATGQPYQTRLDPPPAHPDAAHPWDEAYLGPELPRDQWWQEGSEGVGSEGVGSREKADVEPVVVAADSPVRSQESRVQEPPPTLELKHPEPPAKPKPEAARPSVQPSLITEFNPPEGNRNQRLKAVMALGDRVQARPQDSAAVAGLAAALGDEENSVRWVAASALKILSSRLVVQTLAAYLEQGISAVGTAEARKLLGQLVEIGKSEEVRAAARETLSKCNGND
jgi:hypothetical protein